MRSNNAVGGGSHIRQAYEQGKIDAKKAFGGPTPPKWILSGQAYMTGYTEQRNADKAARAIHPQVRDAEGTGC